jgi:hypothetical protein
MSLRKYLYGAIGLSVLGLSLFVAGCTDNPREPGVPSGKANGATDLGGEATSASPGGPHIGPPGAGTATNPE